ncbi:MAG: cell division ATP-binding protein FtsE [Negativicoccus massiliensis]|uniref:cell division ATP-binding protein FtsE n=1 Tax=Negativicoccus succinicivorans TaxID=620903 RepID=UPI0026E962B8|nr:cell division ATP-binding protein FtsE [Negativicoccus succinicivorans]MBS5887082.1 cell division ATP-binding protein FtsE [Negativicoccus succinicivorans]MDU3215365.1 cell division ATP-binding protein FtsE [Negativicoccus succinicivorans]MDU4641797.1 cell division ATP-binding protein FtsE [Negativicoccus massiliensis]MDU5027609.1 cell division ATP-binding protein FtsE [Negativicoccus succinicivorans]
MIRFENVSKRYGNNTALRNLNLHIEKGEFVFLVGPSGAGKSTFIKLLSHETVPDEGKVFVDGIEVNRLKKSKIPYLRRKLGIVFQDFRLLPNKTAFENVAFALEVMEVSRTEIKQKVHNALELVNLTAKANQLPANLSGGEQQRVAIARALVNRPVVLIADEPTGNLDPATAQTIMQLFNHINHLGTTIIMVTHAKELVNSMHKRVLTIENGEIVRDVQKGAYDEN